MNSVLQIPASDPTTIHTLLLPPCFWIPGIVRNASHLSHRGDPLLVAKECLAFPCSDCFHSANKRSGKLIPTTQEEPLSSPPPWTATSPTSKPPTTVSQHLILQAQLIETTWKNCWFQLNQECAYITVKTGQFPWLWELYCYGFEHIRSRQLCRSKTKK